MKWRNVALVLSILADRRQPGAGRRIAGSTSASTSSAARWFARPSPSRSNIEDLRGKVATLNVGEASIQEFGDNKTYQIRLPKPEGPDAAANQVVTAVRGMIIKDYPGVEGDGRRIGVGQGQRRAGLGRRAGDRLRHARHRRLHLVPVRMAVRRRGAGHPVPRRVDGARLLRGDPAAGRPQHRRGLPGDRRLFAQRHGRHLRPDPRGSAEISQDGDRLAAQPVA